MTARSKVTLVEAQQIRAKLIEKTPGSDGSSRFDIEEAIDHLLALGLIDTDAALRLVAADE